MVALTDTERVVAERLFRYGADPRGFTIHILNHPAEYYWPKMQEVAESVRDYQLTAVPAGHSVSKALEVSTPILTPSGFVSMSNLAAGDIVYGEYGQRIHVTGRSPVRRRLSYELTFDDGASLLACDEHLWAAHDYVSRTHMRRQCRQEYRASWSSSRLVNTLGIASALRHNGQTNWSIPVASAVRGRSHLSGAYTIGFWLGDGCRGTAVVTIGDGDAPEVLSRIAADGFSCSRQPSADQENCKNYTIHGLRGLLRRYGIFKDKRILVRWLRLRYEDRLALLRGYMDADGWRLAHGKSAAVGTTDRRMYETVVPFVASFGNKVFCKTETITYKGQPKLVYKLNFTPRDQPFCLARKQLQNSLSVHARRRQTARMILDCQPVGEKDVCCIETDNPSGLYLAGPHLVPTHNTHGAGRIVPWFKTCYQPSTVITTAPSDNQVRNQLWRQIHGAYAAANGVLGGKMTALQWDLRPSDEVLQQMDPAERQWWFLNFAMGFSTSPDTVSEHATKIAGWHNRWMLIVLDEACGIAPPIWRTVMDALVINEQVKVLAIGNPTDPEAEFAAACRLNGSLEHLAAPNGDMRGPSVSYMGDEGWHVVPVSVFDTPNYKEGTERIPGLAGRSYVTLIEKKHPPGSNGWLIRLRGAFPSHKEGTYYGYELSQAKSQNRIGRFPHDPTFPVYCFADLGDVYTAAIWVQFIRDRVRVIGDYWDNNGIVKVLGDTHTVDGAGAEAFARAMHSVPYTWGKQHYAGPDLTGSNAKKFGQSGQTTQTLLRSLGFNFQPCENVGFNEGIQSVRNLFPLLDIDAAGAATFVKAITGYHKAKNAGLSTQDEAAFHNQPAATWHRHTADALRHLAVAYEYNTINGQYLGSKRVIAQYRTIQRGKRGKYDPMEWVA